MILAYDQSDDLKHQVSLASTEYFVPGLIKAASIK